MTKICFIANNINSGGACLRIHQIADSLIKYNKDYDIIKFCTNNIHEAYNIENAIFFWIYPRLNLHYEKISKTNVHILDIIDNYIYNKESILNSMKFSNALMVNNKYMKKYFEDTYNFKKNIFIVYHHFDTKLNIDKNIKTKLTFGFMGSVKSLTHSDNLLHYKELKKLYDIEFFDTEIGDYVTNYVNNNDYSFKKPNIFSVNNMPKTYKFNCHLSIRKEGTELSKFKTTAKIATAAAVGHNIIITQDECTNDILPSNYPFILKKTDFDNVKKMIELVIEDFNGEKTLWNEGLKIMIEIRNKLDINTIINDYIHIIDSF